MTTRRNLIALLASAASLPLMNACGLVAADAPSAQAGDAGSPAASQAPRQQSAQRAAPAGTLRLAGASPISLDPALTQDVSSWAYMLQIFGGLVRLNDKLEVEPDIAESWSVSPDNKTYTFQLRSDAAFHDGRTVTADDFKYSLERALDPKTKAPVVSTYLGDIVGAIPKLTGKAREVSGIRVVDSKTLVLEIDAPKPYFLSKLTYPVAFVLDKADVQGGADWFKKPNGAGPFRLEKWTKDTQLLLTRADKQRGEAPKLRQIDYFLGPSNILGMYERGELDICDIGAGNIERVMDPRGVLVRELTVAPQLSVQYLGFNTSMPPFDDLNVRQAFAHATDKKRLTEVTFKRMRVQAEGIMPPGLPGYDPAFRGLEFDLGKARALLSQSRYAGKMPEIVLTTGARGGTFGESLAEMFKRNLDVDIRVEEVAEGYYDNLGQRAYQLFYIGWVADYPDPENFLDLLFHSQSAVNHGGFSDSGIDALLEKARIEPDRPTRLKLYQDAQREIVRLAPVVPVHHDTEYALVKPRVQGLNLTSMGLLSFRGVTVGS